MVAAPQGSLPRLFTARLVRGPGEGGRVLVPGSEEVSDASGTSGPVRQRDGVDRPLAIEGRDAEC